MVCLHVWVRWCVCVGAMMCCIVPLWLADTPSWSHIHYSHPFSIGQSPSVAHLLALRPLEGKEVQDALCPLENCVFHLGLQG